MKVYVLAALGLLTLSSAQAADPTKPTGFWSQWGGERRLLADLVKEGYEVRGAVILDRGATLYLQKGTSVYSCLAEARGDTVRHSSHPFGCLALNEPYFTKY